MHIDSHHHFWLYDSGQYPWISAEMSELRRDFTAEHLAETVVPLGVDGVVSVQARQTVEETEWLLQIAEHSELVRAVVGWVPLASAKLHDVLQRCCQSPWLRAVRHVVQDERDERFLLGDNFNRGMRALRAYNLVYDILIYARQLPAAIDFVDLHAEQPFVLDHIAKPTIRRDVFDRQWQKHIRELARREHVVCKFSGVSTEVRDPTWNLDLVRPYWEAALDAFGPHRMLFGSDWPVCLLRTSYARWHDTVSQLCGGLSEAERVAVFGGNALRVYNIAAE